jgi:hypothetical protein
MEGGREGGRERESEGASVRERERQRRGRRAVLIPKNERVHTDKLVEQLSLSRTLSQHACRCVLSR